MGCASSSEPPPAATSGGQPVELCDVRTEPVDAQRSAPLDMDLCSNNADDNAAGHPHHGLATPSAAADTTSPAFATLQHCAPLRAHQQGYTPDDDAPLRFHGNPLCGTQPSTDPPHHHQQPDDHDDGQHQRLAASQSPAADGSVRLDIRRNNSHSGGEPHSRAAVVDMDFVPFRRKSGDRRQHSAPSVRLASRRQYAVPNSDPTGRPPLAGITAASTTPTHADMPQQHLQMESPRHTSVVLGERTAGFDVTLSFSPDQDRQRSAGMSPRKRSDGPMSSSSRLSQVTLARSQDVFASLHPQQQYDTDGTARCGSLDQWLTELTIAAAVDPASPPVGGAGGSPPSPVNSDSRRRGAIETGSARVHCN